MEEVAKRLQVSKRTLRSWKAKAKKDCDKRSGRPSYSNREHRRALIMVARELHKQGYPGSPAIACALKDVVPLRLIRLYVGKINLRRRKKLRETRELNRVSIIVKASNVIWSQDGTHLGRKDCKAVEAQVIKDRASQKVLCVSTGKSADSVKIVSILENLKKSREVPLVWMTDNGPCYVNKDVENYVKKEKIIHLRSMPRVPEHNGSAERTMCELKTASLLGKKTVVHDQSDAHEVLVKNVIRINEHRKRETLGFKTSHEVDEELKNKIDHVDREALYEEYCRGRELLRIMKKGRELKLCEREMVMCLLEKYELIKRTRGGKDYVA